MAVLSTGCSSISDDGTTIDAEQPAVSDEPTPATDASTPDGEADVDAGLDVFADDSGLSPEGRAALSAGGVDAVILDNGFDGKMYRVEALDSVLVTYTP
ncbi:MAG: hypothetical protein ACK4MD_07410 [Demequina sp.]